MRDLASALVQHAGHRLRGTLEIDDGAGRWTAGAGNPVVRVAVHDKRAFGAIVRRGSVGLAEGYVAGWWDTEDLTGAIRLLLAAVAGPLRALDRAGRMATGPLSLIARSRVPDRYTDRRNVRAHYDLPDELFAAMLDDSMMYSCAVFVTPDTSLADAQLAKLDRICTKLALGPNDHVVEIGTGWGSFALYAASRYGCRVTTTTVSRSQEETAIRRVKEAGLTDRIDVLGSDYRDLKGTYDKLVSIEMIEAVDWRLHDTFFSTCQRLLKPDGLMFLQSIVIADSSYERAKHHNDFIRRMIFPGGCIPSITAISASLARATELRLFDVEDIGCHYATTLRRWVENLEVNWEKVEKTGLDNRFHRLWRLYLCYCEAAFLERHISDVQLLIAGSGYRPSLSLRPT